MRIPLETERDFLITGKYSDRIKIITPRQFYSFKKLCNWKTNVKGHQAQLPRFTDEESRRRGPQTAFSGPRPAWVYKLHMVFQEAKTEIRSLRSHNELGLISCPTFQVPFERRTEAKTHDVGLNILNPFC